MRLRLIAICCFIFSVGYCGGFFLAMFVRSAGILSRSFPLVALILFRTIAHIVGAGCKKNQKIFGKHIDNYFGLLYNKKNGTLPHANATMYLENHS